MDEFTSDCTRKCRFFKLCHENKRQILLTIIWLQRNTRMHRIEKNTMPKEILTIQKLEILKELLLVYYLRYTKRKQWQLQQYFFNLHYIKTLCSFFPLDLTCLYSLFLLLIMKPLLTFAFVHQILFLYLFYWIYIYIQGPITKHSLFEILTGLPPPMPLKVLSVVMLVGFLSLP